MSFKPEQIILKPALSAQETEKLLGSFLDDSHYDRVINHDADVYGLDEHGQKHILFYFRRKWITKKELDISLDVFKEAAETSSSARGLAGGPVDLTKIGVNAVGLVTPGNVTSQVIFADGHISRYRVSNRVNSMIAGYYDKHKLRNKSTDLSKGVPPCRLTAFTENNFDAWMKVMPMIQKINGYYELLDPDHFNAQKYIADSTPSYIIKDTVFSSATINLTYQTAAHKDAGDFRHGLTAITVAVQGRYTGGYLVYPQYRVAVDIQAGDFVLQDPHKVHGNTAIIPKYPNEDYTRMSMIFYYREGMTKCEQVQSGGASTSTSIQKNPNPKPKLKLKPRSQTQRVSNLPSNLTSITVLPKRSDTQLNLMIRPDTTDIKVIEEVLTRGVYELKKIKFYLEPTDVWLDLGANIATFSLLCRNRGARVIGFEPEPQNFAMLSNHMRTNFPHDTQKKSQMFEEAVGATAGTVNLYLCSGEYNKYRHTIFPKRGRTAIAVPMRSFKDVLAEYPEITAIKIDNEGAEIAILESMSLKDWTATNVKKLVYEYSFDVDKSIPRFMAIIRNLEKYFDVVHFTKVKPDELEYTFFPPATLVFAIKY
jgi:FkbM family methyltransferase